MSNAKAKSITVGIALLLLFSVIGGVVAYEQVPEGHSGVEKNWGAVNGNVLDSGANWVVPIMQDVQAVETRPRTYTMSNSQGEGDKSSREDAISVKTVNGSTVNVDITVRYRIRDESSDEFVSEWNNERQMEQRLIRPTIRTVIRDEASSLTTTGAGSIYTQPGRQALEETAESALNEEFVGQPIVLEAVQIRNINLPDEIDNTLDQKEAAKQQVEVEKEQVKQEQQKKQQRIVQAEADAEEVRISAEADAEATKIRGEALEEHPIVLRQQEIEALEEGNTIYVPVGDGNGLTLTRQTGADTNSTASP